MKKRERILRWSLLFGAAYFLLIAAAHMVNLKVPVLYIYYDVPSLAYQDKIISALSFGWAVFLYAASRTPLKNPGLIKAVLVAGAGAIISLSSINATTDFRKLSEGANTAVFWYETAALVAYLLWVGIVYALTKRGQADQASAQG